MSPAEMIASRNAHYEQRVAEILAPAINAKAPHAKVMIGMIGMIGELFGEQESAFKRAIHQISAGLPRELMITVDVDGNYAVEKRD